MAVKKVKVQTINHSDRDALVLILKRYADGWTYEVQDLSAGPLPLPWRTATVAEAEARLRATYDAAVWQLTIVENG